MALSPGLRQALKMAAGWGVAAILAVAGIAHFDRIKTIAGLEQARPSAPSAREAQPHRSIQAPIGRVVELRAGAYGHFHTSAEINGRPVKVMVDSGASIVALTYEDASAAGLYVRNSDFTHTVSTANGMARVAPVTLDRVSIGDITVRSVPGAVMEQGKLGTTLLGMSFLNRLQRVDMRSGTLVLQE
jgi:aspartyl protease family protein